MSKEQFQFHLVKEYTSSPQSDLLDYSQNIQFNPRQHEGSRRRKGTYCLNQRQSNSSAEAWAGGDQSRLQRMQSQRLGEI